MKIFYIKIFVMVCLLMAFMVRWAEATPARFNGGSIEFAKGSFGSQSFWSQKEIDEANASMSVFSATSPAAVTVLTPTQWEVNLSTIIAFRTYQEFMDCQTRSGLKAKIMEMRQTVNSMSDLPPLISKDYLERLGWLKSYYLSLP